VLPVQPELDESKARAVADNVIELFNGVGREIGSKMASEISTGLGSQGGGLFTEISRAATSMGSDIVAGAALGATALTALAAAGAAVSAEAFHISNSFAEMAQSMAESTGAVGDQLNDLMTSVQNVGRETSASFEDISTVMGSLSANLQLTGAPLEELTKSVSELNEMTGNKLNVNEFGMAMRAFGQNADEAAYDLEALNAAHRQTGAAIGDLLSQIDKVAPAAQTLGLNFSQTAELMVDFSKAGIDAGRTSFALTHAADEFAKKHIDLNTGLQDTITQIKGLTDQNNALADAKAVDLATKVFGARGSEQFVQAIRDSKLTLADLTGGIKQTNDTIHQTYKETETLGEKWSETWHNMELAMKPVGDFLSHMVGGVLDIINNTGEVVPSTLPSSDQPITPLAPKDLLAPQKVSPFPGAPPAPPGAAGSPSLDELLMPQTNTATIPAPPPRPVQDIAGALAGGGKSQLPQDHAELPQDHAVKQKQVQVPYAPGYGGPARAGETQQQYDAEQRLMEIQHTVAEDRAKLAQIEADSTHTTEDLTKANNDLIKARGEEYRAQLQLQDVYLKASDKLGEIGAKLDADFGASKGLPGLVDNTVKALADIAAAPMLGQLSATAAMSPIQGGYGLAGMWGADNIASGLSPMGFQLGGGPGTPSFDALRALGMSPQQMSSMGFMPGAAPGMASPYDSIPQSSAPQVGPQPSGTYGLPAGTNTGGYGSGGKGIFPDWVQQLGAAFGVTPSTYPGHQETDRHEAGYAPNPTHENRGIDWTGSPQAMQRFADYLKTVPGMEQVIWNGAGVGTGDTVEIAGGRPQPGYFAGDLAEHGNHVHTRQSKPIPLPGGQLPLAAPSGASAGAGTDMGSVTINASSVVVNAGGVGASAPIGGAGGPGAGSATGSSLWDAVMLHEGGTWNNADTGHNGHYGGLQFSPSTWKAYGGVGMPQDATRDQQIEIANRTAFTGYNGTPPQGLGAWQAITDGKVPGVTTDTPQSAFNAPTGWGGPQGLPAGLHGGAGESPVFAPHGPMAGSAAGAGLGPGQGPTQIGGVAPPSGSGAGGIGITPGGGVDAAVDLAASAFPGVGQAAATGVKLANRAIQYAGQVAGIGMQGLMETFLPTGGSDLASHSWLAKGVGALAGARPQLPNMAGKSTLQPGQGQQGAQQQSGGDTNITVNNQRATEDGTGRDIAYHQQQAQLPAGMP
jgi:hypothetical protein